MKVLVTGSEGFIGTHLVGQLLKANHHVFCLDKDARVAQRTAEGLEEPPNHVSFRGDIRNVEFMTRTAQELSGLWGNMDVIIHLAAVASPRIAQRDPDLAWSTNVMGTHNVLDLCGKIRCPKIVFFSSAHVYGISPKYLPTDERHPLALLDTYTTTKVIGEELCRLYYENYGISHVTLRLFNGYGPGQSADYFIGKKIQQGLDGHLTIMNENVTKDWVHVDDIVSAAMAAMHTEYVGALNVGTGLETRLGEIALHISEHFNTSIEKESTLDEGPTRMACDGRRIKRVLKWTPRWRFKDGLLALCKSAEEQKRRREEGKRDG